MLLPELIETNPPAFHGMRRRVFHHNEIRYLVGDPTLIRDMLKRHGVLGVYRVRTLYLDTPEGTWSVPSNSKFNLKMRLRSYNDENLLWLESKSRSKNGNVTKHRYIVSEPPRGYRTVAEVRYRREAFQKSSLRVTVDTHITAIHANGLQTCFPRAVVEVKTKREPPKWLRKVLPDTPDRWSKVRWALATQLQDEAPGIQSSTTDPARNEGAKDEVKLRS
jgi:hypothetical protein